MSKTGQKSDFYLKEGIWYKNDNLYNGEPLQYISFDPIKEYCLFKTQNGTLLTMPKYLFYWKVGILEPLNIIDLINLQRD